MGKIRATFFSFYTHEIADAAAKAAEINRQYCKRHGYKLVVETDYGKICHGCAGRYYSWYCLKMIDQLLGSPDTDWLVKIDADAAVFDHGVTLDDLVRDDDDIVLSTDRGMGDRMNAGVMLIRNCEENRGFFRRAWAAGDMVARGYFLGMPWHEQTVLSAAVALHDPAVRPRIRVIPWDCEKSFNCLKPEMAGNCFILHDTGRQVIPRLKPTAADPLKWLPEGPEAAGDPIAVVFYAFLAPGWQKQVGEQLGRLKESGLYDAATFLYVVSSDPNEATESGSSELAGMLRAAYPKADHWHAPRQNWEYHALLKVQEISRRTNLRILYYHTKGNFNVWKSVADRSVSPEKAAGKFGWRMFMEHFCIDRWRDCLEKLKTHGIVAAFYDHHSRWVWGNFWWTTSRHIRSCDPLGERDRWYYEGWLPHHCDQSVPIAEFWHPEFDFHTSDIPVWLYDGSRNLSGDRIVIREARYGTQNLQIDEGRPAPPDKLVYRDVTAMISENAEKNGGRKIDMGQVSNATMGGDPDYGHPKTLIVRWSLASEPDKTYCTRVQENSPLLLELP